MCEGCVLNFQCLVVHKNVSLKIVIPKYLNNILGTKLYLLLSFNLISYYQSFQSIVR